MVKWALFCSVYSMCVNCYHNRPFSVVDPESAQSPVLRELDTLCWSTDIIIYDIF